MLEGMCCVLFEMLEAVDGELWLLGAVEGGLCLLEPLEVSEVSKV